MNLTWEQNVLLPSEVTINRRPENRPETRPENRLEYPEYPEYQQGLEDREGLLDPDFYLLSYTEACNLFSVGGAAAFAAIKLVYELRRMEHGRLVLAVEEEHRTFGSEGNGS